MSQATESLFAENHEHFFNSIGQTEKTSMRANVFRCAANIGHCGSGAERILHNGHCGEADIPVRERAEVKPDVCRYRLRGTAVRTSSNGDRELPSVSQEAVDDFSVDLAGAQATGTIVMLLGHTRIRVMQHRTGEVRSICAVRSRGGSCSSAKEVG
jgi:hypothetical protein